MTAGFERKVGAASLVHEQIERPGSAAAGPGKRTLTEQLPILRTATGDGAVPAAAHDHVASASQSSGSALPAALGTQLGTALGADVSSVRVHTGRASAASADALNARAYAMGQDIHFGAGAYDPSSQAGRHLIAHEVAHTVQQQGAATGIQRAAMVSTPGDAAERQAESFATAFVSGASTQGLVTAGMQPAAAIHRYERDEHAALSTTHLIALYDFLKTPDGKKWAKDHGYKNPGDLIKRIEADPVVKTNNEPLKQGETEKHVAKLHGAKTDFSYGDITALMGDLFGHWESLYNADEDQRKHLMTEDSTSSNEKYTHGEYLKLAAKNNSHFAGENLKAWAELHQQAIAQAMTSGKDETKFNQALFIEAASTHFLTDAFSSGHQFEKQPLLDAVQIDLQKHPLVTENPQMQTYVAIADLADPTNIANLIVKAVHDRMNQEGFDVTNGKGMKWRTFGDGNLARSPETQRIAALAVFESRQQVFQARNAKTPPDISSVREFFPDAETRERANLQALAYVPEARKQVEKILYANRKDAKSKLGKVGGYLVEHNLEAIGDPARERDILQQQEFDRVHGGTGQAVVPQFEWRFGK
jgi:hypothetical protein